MSGQKNILITGGLGYLGSHTASVFAEAGFHVVLIDNLSNAHLSTFETLEQLYPGCCSFYEKDLRNLNELQEVFQQYHGDFSAILHFASKNKKQESCREPFLYYESNIQGTLNLLHLMKEYQIRTLVFASSSSVYDIQKVLPPFTETDKVDPATPYSTSLLAVEGILRDMAKYQHFHIAVMRYFNPVGTHPSHLLGPNPKGIPTKILPLLIKVAQGQINEFPVYGNHYETTDGTCLMDYVHIMDIAQAHLQLVQWLFSRIDYEHFLIEHERPLENEGSFEIINLASGIGKTIKEVIHLTEMITGKEIPVHFFPQRPGDTPLMIGNANKAKQLFGWAPQRTLIDAIEDLWQYEQKKNLTPTKES